MITAHQLDHSGKIINTVVARSLSDLPMLVDASIGGRIGDSIINGIVVKTPLPSLTDEQFNAPIIAQLDELDAKTIRPLREGETARVAELAAQAAALRAQLRK